MPRFLLLLLTMIALVLGVAPASASAAPGWVDLGAAPEQGNPSALGFDADGDAVGVYSRYTGSVDWTAVDRPAGAGAVFSGEAPPASQRFGVNHDLVGFGVEPDGDAFAVTLYSGSLFSWTRPSGGAWGEPEVLASGEERFGNYQTRYVQTLPDGRAVVAWLGRVSGEWVVRVRRRGTDGAWSGVETIDPPGNVELFSVHPSMGADGTVTVAWAQYLVEGGYAHANIWQSTRPADATGFADPQEVTVADDLDHTRPEVGVDDEGRATLVWLATEPGGAGCRRLRYATRAAGETEFGPPFLAFFPETDGTFACKVNQFGTAMTADGETVGWFDTTDGELRMIARAPDGGVAVQAAVPGVSQHYGAALAVAPDGSAAVAWYDNDSITRTWLRRDGMWGELTPLAGRAYPQPAFDRDSHLVLGTTSNSEPDGWRAWDDTGPEVTGLTAPDGDVGAPIQFGFEATDAYSAVDAAATEWSFSKAGQDTIERTGASPSVTFTDPGEWTVTAIVADALGNTTTRTGSVRVRPPNMGPTAAFVATPSTAESGQTVTLDGSGSSDPDDDPLTFAWDFDGDGTADQTSGDAIVEIAYPRSGLKTVELTVSDGRGGSSTTERTVTVTNRAPSGTVGAAPASAPTDEAFTFTPSGVADPDGSVDRIEWDLDGDFATVEALSEPSSPELEHAFDRPGTKTVRMRVVDDEGATSPVATATVTATNRAPAATYVVTPDPVQVGQVATFDGTGSADPDGSIAGYEWDLDGDNDFEASSATATITKTYAAAGAVTTHMRVVDDLGERSAAATRTLTVQTAPLAPNAKPVARLSLSASTVRTDTPVTFSATGSSDGDGSIVRYDWDVDGDAGNGFETSTAGAELTRSYAVAGSYPVRLRVLDNRGDLSAVVADSVVVEAPPAPALVPGPTLAEQAAAVEAAAAAGGFEVTVPSFTIVSSRRERKVPGVVGMHVDKAREVFAAVHYVDLELDWTHRKPRRGDVKLGEVVAQTPAAGTVTDSGAADLLRVVLDVYAGPKGRRDAPCPDGFEKAVRKKDFDLGRELIDEACTKKAKVDDLNFKLANGGQDMTIRSGIARRHGKEIDLNVAVPRDPRQHDLFMVFREMPRANSGSSGHTFDELWRLRGKAGKQTCLQVQVFDRSKFFIHNATVRLEGSDVGGDDAKGTTDAQGSVDRLCAELPKTGTLDVVTYATGTNGESVFGATQVEVKHATGYRTPSGRALGKVTRTAFAAAWGLDWVTGAASSLATWAGGQIATASASVRGALSGIYDGLGAALAAGRSNVEAWAKAWDQAWKSIKLQPANIAPGGVLSGNADPMQVQRGSVTAAGGCSLSPKDVGEQVRAHVAGGAPSPLVISSIIACGRGTLSPEAVQKLMFDGGRRRSVQELAEVIATGGLNVISTGGGNVISTGGGNVIATGGGNVVAVVAGVISTGGGNLATADLEHVAGVIGTGGLNLKDQVMAGVIATGGLNLTPQQAAGVIATGGLNFSAQQIAGLIGQAGGNLSPTLIANGVIATGGGNVIATGGGNVIATGGGNVIATGGGNRSANGLAAGRGLSRTRSTRQAAGADPGFVTSAADGSVLVCPKAGCIAFSKPDASVFGSGEGIAPEEVKDVAHSVVLPVGSDYALVPEG